MPRVGSWVAARRADLIALVVVAMLDVLGQWLTFAGPDIFDPTLYVRDGPLWPHLKPNYWVLRIGVMAPVKLAEQLFGPSRAVLFGLPVLASIVLAVGCYLIVRMLFGVGAVVAASAALVAVLNPDTLLNSTQLFPDPLSTAVFVAALVLLLAARREGPLGRWSGLSVALLAGLFLGWTYLIREFSPILFPGVLAILVLLRYPVLRALAAALGALAMFGVELIYGQIYYGDPLARIHLLIKHAQRPTTRAGRLSEWAPFRADVHNIGQAALILPRLLLAWGTGWTMVALVVLFLVAAVRWHDRRFGVILAWALSAWLILTVVAIARAPGHDPAIEVGNIRYWYQILPAIAIGGIVGLWSLVRGSETSGRRLFLAQGVVVLAALVVIVPGAVEYKNCTDKGIGHAESGAAWTQLAQFLDTPQAQSFRTIEAEKSTTRPIAVYTDGFFGGQDWTGQIVPVDTTTVAGRAGSGPTLLFFNDQRSTKAVAQMALAHWQPVWVSSDDSLALLAPRSVGGGGMVTDAGALAQRWIAGYDYRPFVAGQCGNSPYATS